MALFTYPLQSVSISGAAQESTLQQVEQNTQPLDVVDQLDSTLVDTSSTNIPGNVSLPVQVVAALAADVKKIIVVEDIGEYYGVFTGPASSEVLKAVVPLGGGEVECEIASGTRISLRSLTTSAINSGSVAINFLG